MNPIRARLLMGAAEDSDAGLDSGPARAAAAALRLDEDLVAEGAWVGQMHQDLGALSAGGVDLNAAVAEHPPEQRLLGGAVLPAVDRHRLRLASEDAGLDLDALVGERVRDRLPADPDHDEPQQ